MSQNIFLIQYESDESERLYEENSIIIESTFISSTLLEEIEKQWSLVEKKIYEEKGVDENFKVNYFKDDLTQDICTWLENFFLKLLISESPNSQVEDASTNTSLISSDYINKDELSSLIERFRTVTNLIRIFTLKNNKYSDDKSVVLKLG